MSEDRENERRYWKQLQFLLAVHKVQRRFADVAKEAEYSEIPNDLRCKQILDTIKSIRTRLKKNRKLSFRKVVQSKTRNALDKLFGAGPAHRRTLSMNFGKKVDCRRTVNTSNAADYDVYIGWMWLYKVWEPIYSKGKWELPLVVLGADKVRVNNKLMDVYEVQAFDASTSGGMRGGYVAVARHDGKPFWGLQATTAINAAMRHISSMMDEMLIGKGTQDD